MGVPVTSHPTTWGRVRDTGRPSITASVSMPPTPTGSRRRSAKAPKGNLGPVRHGGAGRAGLTQPLAAPCSPGLLKTGRAASVSRSVSTSTRQARPHRARQHEPAPGAQSQLPRRPGACTLPGGQPGHGQAHRSTAHWGAQDQAPRCVRQTPTKQPPPGLSAMPWDEPGVQQARRSP